MECSFGDIVIQIVLLVVFAVGLWAFSRLFI